MAVSSASGSGISNFSRYNSAASPSIFQAFGGTVEDSGGYRIHTFAASGEFVVTKGSKSVDVLIVAGGGGGGAGNPSGGGGGGGVIEQAFPTNVGSGTYPVVVGAAGAITGVGGNSSLLGLTAIGGGNGGIWGSTAATTGGSGGGGSSPTQGQAGISGQGNAGGNYGGPTGNTPARGGGGGGGKGGDGGGAAFTYTGNSAYNVVGGAGGAAYASPYTVGSIEFAGGGGGNGVSPNRSGSPGGSQGRRVPGSGDGGSADAVGYSGTVVVRYLL